MIIHNLMNETMLPEFNGFTHIAYQTYVGGNIFTGGSDGLDGVIFVKKGESRFLVDTKDFDFQYKNKTFSIKLIDLVRLLINAELVKRLGKSIDGDGGLLQPKVGSRRMRVPYSVILEEFTIDKLWLKSLPIAN